MQWLVEFALCVGVVFFSLPPIAEKYFSPSIGFGVAVGLLSDIFWIFSKVFGPENIPPLSTVHCGLAE